jgi:Domain of unknown function (DUF4034)
MKARITSLIVCSLLSVGLCLAQKESADNRSLAEIARELREKKEALKPIAPTPAKPVAKASIRIAPPPKTPVATTAVAEDDERVYTNKIRGFLAQEDFNELEQAALNARATKGRLSGGVWRLYRYYEVVTEPVGGENASAADWAEHLERLKRWEKLQPLSVTVQVALAQTYLNLGWHARGSGPAMEVSEDGWKAFENSMRLAKAALKKADETKDRCPHLYEVALQIAITEGWSRKEASSLFEEAIAFEPAYYHYYNSYASYLQERFYGEKGEAVQFAEKSADRFGGKPGAFLYFELASVLCGHPDSEIEVQQMNWDRIKEGYAAMEALYGTSLLKQNRFAFLASRAGDKATTQHMLLQIKTNWNPSVWGQRRLFEQARLWALTDSTASVNGQ